VRLFVWGKCSFFKGELGEGAYLWVGLLSSMFKCVFGE